ncbi:MULTISPECIES: hypothetical protein [unclassified Saccharicrinis]|uniref:hypothetical protein n=1 Tax=unclassified Saccharicrinis TaxID=2646859 RepID=UPI003D32CAA1
MKLQRVSMLFDALTTFFTTNYCVRENQEFQDEALLPNSEEIREMVILTTKKTGLDTLQKVQITELFLTHFNRIREVLKSGCPDMGEIKKQKSQFNIEVAYFFGDYQPANIRTS